MGDEARTWIVDREKISVFERDAKDFPLNVTWKIKLPVTGDVLTLQQRFYYDSDTDIIVAVGHVVDNNSASNLNMVLTDSEMKMVEKFRKYGVSEDVITKVLTDK